MEKPEYVDMRITLEGGTLTRNRVQDLLEEIAFLVCENFPQNSPDDTILLNVRASAIETSPDGSTEIIINIPYNHRRHKVGAS